MLKEKLDIRICDDVKEASNTETYREFILNSEDEFELEHSDIDTMTEEELEDYIEYLDTLWDN
jgi:hypothetical protein